MQPFRVFVPANALSLLLIEALLIAVIFVAVTVCVLPSSGPDFWQLENGGGRVAAAVAVILLGLYLQNLYNDLRVLSRVALFQQLCFVLGGSFILQAVFAYIVPNYRVPIRIMLPGGFLAMSAVFAIRIFYSKHFLQMARWDQMLLVGSAPSFAELEQYVEAHPETGMGIIGYVGDRSEDVPAGGKWIGRMEALADIAQSTQPRRLLVGTSGRIGDSLAGELLRLRFGGYNIEDIGDACERILGRVNLASVTPGQLLYGQDFSPPSDVTVQWLSNYAMAGVAAIVFSPALLLGAVMARLAYSGPILSRERKVGFQGRVFQMYRFRSDTAHARWPLMARVLIRLRLERLPVIANLLKGDLAIVGPAVERAEFAEVIAREIPFYPHRHNVRPGLTGWAQIHGSSSDTIRQLEHDLYYVKNTSLALDTLVLLQAAKLAVLRLWGVDSAD